MESRFKITQITLAKIEFSIRQVNESPIWQDENFNLEMFTLSNIFLTYMRKGNLS